MPIDPIEGILQAFDAHEVVALSEGRHNNEQAHAFRLQLVRDPRFDAILYLGPPASITMSKLPASSCADARYMGMREQRALILSAAGAAELKRYCEQVEADGKR